MNDPQEPDYARELRGDRKESDHVLRDLRDAILSLRQPVYRNGDDNKSSAAIVMVGAGLLIAFVTGGWILSNQVASLQATMGFIVNHIKEQDERIYRIEQQENARRP